MLLLVVLCSTPLWGLSEWKTPDSSLRFDQVTFLTSHNSYAAKKYGYWYAQQYWSIKEQLAHGVRGLMLDTFENRSSHTICLCHGGLFIDTLLRSGKKTVTFAQSLEQIKDFLDKNPSEIITLFLENYVTDGHFLDTVLRSTTIDEILFKPNDWDPAAHKWPTLAWMQKHNKRLIIFNSQAQTDLTFHEWQHVIENQFGTLSIHRACNERKESKKFRAIPRHLCLINFIPRLKINFGNSYESINSIYLENLAHQIMLRWFSSNGPYEGKRINFINIDFVNEGDGMKLVNSLNQWSSVSRSPL